MSRIMKVAILAVISAAAFACTSNPKPSGTPDPRATPPIAVPCIQFQDDPIQLLVCLNGLVHPTATPTPQTPTAPPPVTSSPATATAAPSVSASPTNTPSAAIPPTVLQLSGCHADDPNSVDPKTGVCEFNTIMVEKISDPRFTPPCDRNQCPSFWNPHGMGMACDHMFTGPNEPGGIFNASIGRWVSIMYYVCGNRLWDWPGHVEVEIRPMSGSVLWQSRTKRKNDPYNGTISGHGTYLVCLPATATYCLDVGDYDDAHHDATYGPGGHCEHGETLLPGAGACVGPFTVNR